MNKLKVILILFSFLSTSFGYSMATFSEIKSVNDAVQLNNGSVPMPDDPTDSKNKPPWNEVHPTPSSHPIAFKPGVLKNTGIVTGDVIGVFTPEDLCAGLIEITDINAGTAVMAFADDITTPQKDGFATGEMFLFKLFSHQQNTEYDLSVTYDPTLPNTSQFEVQGLSAITQVTLLPVSVDDNREIISAIYPNPSFGYFNLAMNHWPKDLQIQVLDTQSNILKTINPESKLNGASLNIDLSNLQGGVYYLKLIHQNNTETKKIVIN